MSTDNDQYLIKAILEHGDTKDFTILVNRYKNMVFTLSLQLLKNREEAEEVAQDVFFKIFRSLALFKGDSKLSTWIYRITYNSCLDRLKSISRRQLTVDIDDFSTEHVQTMESALDLLERSEREATIKECLSKLPVEDGTVLTLFYYQELSLPEISEIVGIEQNTLKVRLFRARKRLAVLLKMHLEPAQLQHYGQGNR
ncbi:MAG: RNA polymerase sigma factor [Flavobacteriaceae bacterium]